MKNNIILILIIREIKEIKRLMKKQEPSTYVYKRIDKLIEYIKEKIKEK